MSSTRGGTSPDMVRVRTVVKCLFVIVDDDSTASVPHGTIKRFVAICEFFRDPVYISKIIAFCGIFRFLVQRNSKFLSLIAHATLEPDISHCVGARANIVLLGACSSRLLFVDEEWLTYLFGCSGRMRYDLARCGEYLTHSTQKRGTGTYNCCTARYVCMC